MQTDKIKAYQKAYRDAHKEERKAYQDVYCKSHKEERKANRDKYHELHKEEIKERDKARRESNREKFKEYRKAYYDQHRDPNTNRMGSKEHSIVVSCAMRNMDVKDFNGFAGKRHTYTIPIRNCIQMNDWFEGSHAHHITKSIIIYIPSELHRHIRHNLRTGHNMGEINALAIQFVNGGL